MISPFGILYRSVPPILLVLTLLSSPVQAQNTPPVVSNVVAQQADHGYVTVTYDLYDAEGDDCYLNLLVQNPGTARTVDLYVLLEAYGEYFAYPSWTEVDDGIDFNRLEFPAGAEQTLRLVPPFTMPPVSPAGPFHFYAAMFERGFLDLDHLASNGAVWEFRLE